MKLYATTTSERASKGQGGNKEIVIDLTIDPVKRKTIGRVVMKYDDIEGYVIYYYPINEECTEQKINSGRVLLYQEKGERQKGALCGNCYKREANIGDTLCEPCAKQNAQ